MSLSTIRSILRSSGADKWLPVLIYVMVWLAPNLVLLKFDSRPATFVKLGIALVFCIAWHLAVGRLRWMVVAALPFFLLWPADMLYTLIYRQPPTTHILPSLMSTNWIETSDYMRGRWFSLGTLGAISLGSWGWLFHVAPSVPLVPGRIRKLVHLAAFATVIGFGVLTINLIRPVVGQAIATAQGEPIGPANSRMLKIKGVFPIGRLVSIAEYIREEEAISRALEIKEGFRFGVVQAEDRRPLKQAYVLVIGEAARSDRWSLNGYKNDTTPHLAKMPGVVSFSNVISPYTLTTHSVPALLTCAPVSTSRQMSDRSSIISLFGEAGFSTYWLSTQPVFGNAESVITYLAREAKEVYFLNASGNAWANVESFDDVLVGKLNELLAKPEPRQFFVIHMMGSHDAYQRRYPVEDDYFKPSLLDLAEENPDHHDRRLRTEINNSYDSSIRYTDFVLSELADTLETSGRVSALVYTSDHGETLFDGNCHYSGHGWRSYYEYPVAAMAWLSNELSRLDPVAEVNLRKNKDAAATIQSMFPTLADLAKLEYPTRLRTASLAAEDYTAPKREVVAGDQLVNWDQAKFVGDCLEVRPAGDDSIADR